MYNNYNEKYVGTIVGESTSREFRLAVARETIREQDIIAVDATLNRPSTDEEPEEIRIWAKVQRIERLNPLFPSEAGHELAETRTDPFDTVLSLSREMVTAVCQVIGSESRKSTKKKLDQLRYPPQPASSAYRPEAPDIKRIILGELDETSKRALDIAALSNRPEVSVNIDGHAIVTRHLAILAMTGAGKSVTARRIIEEIAETNYPIVIFDPHGDYTGLSAAIGEKKVDRYFAHFPIFDEDSDTIARIIDTLGYPLSDTMRNLLPDIFQAAQQFYDPQSDNRSERINWLASYIRNDNIIKYGIQPDMYLIAHLAYAGELALRNKDQGSFHLEDYGWEKITQYTKKDAGTFEAIRKRAYSAARALNRMEDTNRKIANTARSLPDDRLQLVKYGKISIVSLAGYTSDFQATLYSIIVDEIFTSRVNGNLPYP